MFALKDLILRMHTHTLYNERSSFHTQGRRLDYLYILYIIIGLRVISYFNLNKMGCMFSMKASTTPLNYLLFNNYYLCNNLFVVIININNNQYIFIVTIIRYKYYKK